MNNLRPKTISDCIGQREVISRLKIISDSAKQRDDTLPHILLDGPPGTGKTTLAMALAEELSTTIQIANGGNVRSITKILPYVMRITRKSILFIDEVHRLTRMVEELLYPVMEDYRFDVVSNQTTTPFDVPPFCLIGATTEGGSLSAPFRDRFQIQEHLSLYKQHDLLRIIDINSVKLRLTLSDEAKQLIAKVSRGTPRITNNMLTWIRDFTLSRQIKTTIRRNIVVEALTLKGVDREGMNQTDNKYLRCLRMVFRGGPVSLDTLSNATSISKETIIHQIEPFLIRLGKIAITRQGRISL